MRLPAHLLFGLCALTAALSPAHAEPPTIAIAPVFSQLVAMPYPQGFVSIYENARGGNYIHELVPQGETVDEWTQMVTLLGTRDQAQGGGAAAATAFANQVAAVYSRACPDSFSAKQLDSAPVVGAEGQLAGFLSCGNVAGKDFSERMVFLVIAGKSDIYALQWAERGAPSPRPMEYPAGNWVDRLALLAENAKLCKIVRNEPPPYPSCTGS